MDAPEADGRELFGKAFQAIEHDQGCVGIRQPDFQVFTHAFRIADPVRFHPDGPVIHLESQHFGLNRYRTGLFDDVPDPKRRSLEFGETERFQQIIGSMDPEALQGVLRIGRRENHQRRILQRPDEIHPREVGHVDIHIQDIRLPHVRTGGGRRRAGRDQLQEGYLPDIEFQLLESQRLIIDNHDTDHARAASVGRSSRISYTSAFWSMCRV